MFFKKKNKQLRNLKQAKDSLSIAEKVYSYRRDLIPEADSTLFAELLEKASELIISKNYDGEDFGLLEDKLEGLMQKYGGNIYPLKTLTDYIETIVVAGVLALSVRSFFITPFKIPTNSMYPSFYGMTSKIYDKSEGEPNIVEKAWNFAVKAASNYTLEAPDSGDLLLELNDANRYGSIGMFANRGVSSKFLGVYPTYDKEYTFYVNGKSATISVPADFSFDDLVAKAYPLGSDAKDLKSYARAVSNRENIVEQSGRYFLNLGKVKKGELVLNFDILGGDMLFVDKFTYNFKKPQVGDPIVFLTKYCDGMTAMNGGVPDDKYYIKRLVGLGGDTLSIKDYTLLRNGEPITGDESFAKNASQEGLYCGYRQDGALSDGNEVKVPEGMYYAMGDNSANSLDSRYWGFVPNKAVVGKSLLVFYPFKR